MDYILDYANIFFLDHIYDSTIPFPRDNLFRQLFSLIFIVTLGGIFLYLIAATLGFYTTFDRELMKHKRFLKNQVRLEIQTALTNIPMMSLATIPVFLLEVRGHSRLYDEIADFGWIYYLFSIFFYIFFLDMGIYFIHRSLHHPIFYKRIHKKHHKWLVPTPYASHAFYWIDGFLQSTPYHIFVFLFPLHKWTYLALFLHGVRKLIGIFAYSSYLVIEVCTCGLNFILLSTLVNGSAHHTDHHLYFNYNYGEFFTLWDILGGSHRNPRPDLNSIMEKDLDEKIPESREILEKFE